MDDPRWDAPLKTIRVFGVPQTPASERYSAKTRIRSAHRVFRVFLSAPPPDATFLHDRGNFAPAFGYYFDVFAVSRKNR